MADATLASRRRALPSFRGAAAMADLFTIVCALVLIVTAVYLSAIEGVLGVNINLAITALAGVALGLFGLYFPRYSRWSSIVAAVVGLNAILYYMDVYSNACRFNLDMTIAFWVSAVAAGGLFTQVFFSRKLPTLHSQSASKGGSNGDAVRIRSRVSTGSIVLYTVMIVLSFIALVPFFWMISTSFMTLGETINRIWVPQEAQVCNYYTAWNSVRFNVYFQNSIIIAITTITGLLSVSILSAYAFAKINFVGRNLIFTLVLATLMVPDIVVMIPNYLTISGQIFPIPISMTNFPFFEFGIGRGFSWIDTLPALSVPFMGHAFSIFLLRQFFIQIPHELWEAARIDGAGHFRFLVQIVVPMSRPAILTVTLLAFIGSWNALLWPLLVTRDPLEWRPISYGLQAFNDEAGTQTHLLTAAAFITIMPMLALYFVTQKSFTEGIATTGLKG